MNYDSSQSDNLTYKHHKGYLHFLPILMMMILVILHLNDSMGVNKAKLKRKNDEQMSSTFNIIIEQNEQLMEMLKKTSLDRQVQMDIQRKNLALRKMKEKKNFYFNT